MPKTTSQPGFEARPFNAATRNVPPAHQDRKLLQGLWEEALTRAAPPEPPRQDQFKPETRAIYFQD